MKKIINRFLEHPKEVNETYWTHLLFAAKGSFLLLKISLALFIHALFPFLFKTYASKKVDAFAEKFLKRIQSAQSSDDVDLISTENNKYFYD
jgi:hypothetical protein